MTENKQDLSRPKQAHLMEVINFFPENESLILSISRFDIMMLFAILLDRVA